MATLTTRIEIAAVLGISLLGCSKPVGLGAPVKPLVNISVQVNGDLANLAFPRVALVWGMQWQPEPSCALAPESSDMAEVQAAGCPDNFRFVPARDGADVAIQPNSTATISLVDLPGSDVMVGDIASRVAYASLIVYDDSNGDGAFDLRHPPRHRRPGQPAPPPDDGGVAGPAEIVYAASFISMTQPDQRVAFLEGRFNPAVAFYPRNGCPDPQQGFSLLSAGGFAPTPDPLEIARGGGIPLEVSGSCVTAGLDQPVVLASPSPSSDLQALACTANDGGGTSFYVKAPADAPDFYIASLGNLLNSTHPAACTSFPHLSGDDGGVVTGQQLVVASAPTDACQYLTHYTLRRCDDDPACAIPTWDLTASPPSWWPKSCLGQQ
jgi:hypothetical protein